MDHWSSSSSVVEAAVPSPLANTTQVVAPVVVVASVPGTHNYHHLVGRASTVYEDSYVAGDA